MEKIINVPRCLQIFEKELLNLQRHYIAINAIPLKCELFDDPLDRLCSKFLGNPFYPAKDKYPTDKTGKPMVLIAQINFADLPYSDIYPTDGLLQLYLPSDDWWDSESAKIIYLDKDKLKKDPIVNFEFMKSISLEEIPIFKIHKLSFEESVDTGCSEDSQFYFSFGTLGYWDFEDSLNDEDKEEFNEYFSAEGHKIGGYADFTQGDPRDYEAEKKDDIQLLQIDVDDHIMFGDSGVAHIFISAADLAAKDFSKAYFYWDCC